MTSKVNGHAVAAEFIGGNNQFFTVTATFANAVSASTFATVAGTTVDATKTLFDVAVEAIETIETPDIIGALSGGNLVFRFATNRVAGTTEGGSTDPKAPSFATVIGTAVTKSLQNNGFTVAAGDVAIAVVKADTI